jgi:hypothetical protein
MWIASLALTNNQTCTFSIYQVVFIQNKIQEQLKGKPKFQMLVNVYGGAREESF